MFIDVYATARAIEKDLKEHLVIVVDVLRASSVMITAVENGCKSLIPVLEVEDAVAVSRRFGNEKVLLCGERGGAQISGFHLSNSPKEFTSDHVSGRMLVMTTSNGTRAILETGECKKLVIGGFLNAKAVAQFASEEGLDVAIVCAGTNGRFSLDDVVCAGSIISRIYERSGEHSLCDLSLTALSLYDTFREDLYAGLTGSLHFERLRALGLEDDLRYCLREDVMNAIPQYQNGVIRAMQA
ncbi:MAG: 2-phosphosulfolactate phosphatase [Christensenellaceae bacterium]|jgi:2-phosphosulfolactate phosphatase|nr:2-phosphosulfolactate phosphatase [Christensenellaceae bacterium]